jgi:hypothetical protein
MPVDHGVEEAGHPVRALPDVEVVAHVLRRSAVEHEVEQPLHVPGFVALDEPIDRLRRGQGPSRRHRAVGLPKPLSPAMQSGLHGPGRRRQQLGNFLEGHSEHLLEQDGRTLLRREPLKKSRPRLAHLAGGRGIGSRRRKVLGARDRIPRLGSSPSQGVDPHVRRRAQQVRPGVADPSVGHPPLPERSQQRVLNEILGIPEASGQASAVAVERRPPGNQRVDEVVPGRPKLAVQRVREPDLAVRAPIAHFASSRSVPSAR